MKPKTFRSPELIVVNKILKRLKREQIQERRANFSSYSGFDFTPSLYRDADEAAVELFLHSFLKKWKGWGTTTAAREAAIATWIGCEQKNFETNCRLRRHQASLKGDALTLILRVREKIASVLGPLNIDEVLSHGRWSGGATFAHKRGKAAFEKMKSVLDVTNRAVKYLPYIVDRYTGHDLTTDYTIVRGNRCVTVPKTAKTDRMIACEPSANAYMQQGVHVWIRDRLRRVGIDLRSQEYNKRAAFSALVDDLSTIDLSNASDSISLSLVEMLVPSEWFEFLMDLRSPYSLLDGKWYLLEKFSSMGNAFTFELETLIFWAITCVASNSDTILVYGDDIICPNDGYDNVCRALEYFGCTVNIEKSFTAGSHFFESCGGQYFDLEDITPVYQKETVLDKKGHVRKDELIRLYNRLLRWGMRTNRLYLVKDSLLYLRKMGEDAFKAEKLGIPQIPFSNEDGGFLTPIDRLRSNKSGDYSCVVLQKSTKQVYSEKVELPGKDGVVEINPVDLNSQRAAYSLKLRDPSYSNMSRTGHVEKRRESTYKLRKRTFWSSNYIEPPHPFW